MNLARLASALLAALCACGGEADATKVAVPGIAGAQKTIASVRAERRLYDGAPPVIPHRDFHADCIACHTEAGLSVPDVGFAPPSPHAHVAPPAAMSRCQECHVWKLTDEVFRPNDFVGLAQDLRAGKRQNVLAPPVIPHQILLRENCRACHTGPAAREEIRCPHPERERCTQCHVEQKTTAEFAR